MNTNGNGRSLREILADVEADIAREKREEERAHRERLEAELAAVNEKLARLTQPPPLLRSKMTALEKSQFLQARKVEGMSGEQAQAAYFAIPWA